MHKSWNTQKPLETLFRKIYGCVESAEAGGITIIESLKVTTAYTKILTTGIFNSTCLRWDEKMELDKTWENFKISFAASYCQRRQIHGETTAYYRYGNAAVAHPEEDSTESLGAFANMASVTSADFGVVSILNEANGHVDK